MLAPDRVSTPVPCFVIAPDPDITPLNVVDALVDRRRRARLGGAARLEVTSAGHRTDAHAFYRACGFTEGAVRFVKLLGD